MKTIPRIVFLLFIVSACQTNTEGTNAVLYSTSYNELKIDSELYHVVYDKGYFLISQSNLRIAVLDTLFSRQPGLEDTINQFPVAGIYKDQDSVKMYKADDKSIGLPEVYSLTHDWKLKKVKEQWSHPETPGEFLFEDLAYSVFANRIGDHGFFTYFLEKSTQKIYAAYTYSPRQVLKFQGNYYILCDEIKYDSSYTGVFKIKDPSQLYEISFQEAKKLNILFTHLAASPGKAYEQLAKRIEQQKLQAYGYLDRYSTPLYSFEKGKELYSIVKNDSTIYLGKHAGNKIVREQTLFDTSFPIRQLSFLPYKNNTLVIFNSSGGKTVNGVWVDYFDCGFFDIKDTSIDLHRIYREKPSKL